MSENNNILLDKINKLDSIVFNVIKKFTNRAEVGYNKYKTNMDRTDLTVIQWLDHSIEEKMDDIIYMEKIKKELLSNNTNINMNNIINNNNMKKNSSYDNV